MEFPLEDNPVWLTALELCARPTEASAGGGWVRLLELLEVNLDDTAEESGSMEDDGWSLDTVIGGTRFVSQVFVLYGVMFEFTALVRVVGALSTPNP